MSAPDDLDQAGHAYLARITEERDDAITAIAELERDLLRAQADGDGPSIEALALAKARLLRVALTRTKDAADSAMARNLSTFMARIDAYETARAAEAAQIQQLHAAVEQLTAALRAHDAESRDYRTGQQRRVGALEARLAAMEQADAG